MITTSPVAAANPALSAAPLPRFRSRKIKRSIRARSRSSTSRVPSVDPSSTTINSIGRLVARIRSMTIEIVFDSLNAGTTTDSKRKPSVDVDPLVVTCRLSLSYSRHALRRLLADVRELVGDERRNTLGGSAVEELTLLEDDAPASFAIARRIV